jgi:dihydroorotate dehydrogenase
MAIEIGLETDMERSEVGEILHAVQGELPVIVQIPLPFTLELTEGAMVGEVAAISLGPPRGALPGTDGKPVSGRLYGAAIFPFALEAVRLLAKLKVPTIAAGGIENKAQGEAMLAAGAIGVQVDVGLWKGNQLIH